MDNLNDQENQGSTPVVQPVVDEVTTPVVTEAQVTPVVITTPEEKITQPKQPAAKQPQPKQTTPGQSNQNNIKPMSFSEWLNAVIKSGSGFEASVAASLVDYTDRMKKGKPVTQPEIEANQKNLFNLYKAIVQNENSSDFSKGMNVLLRFANEFKTGCFSETHLFRGFEYIKLSKKDIEAFQFFSSFVTSFAAVETRSLASRQIDVAKLASYFNNSNQLVGFINKFKK